MPANLPPHSPARQPQKGHSPTFIPKNPLFPKLNVHKNVVFKPSNVHKNVVFQQLFVHKNVFCLHIPFIYNGLTKTLN